MDQPPGEGEQSEGRGDQAAMGAGARPHAVVRPSLSHCTGSVTFDLALGGAQRGSGGAQAPARRAPFW